LKAKEEFMTRPPFLFGPVLMLIALPMFCQPAPDPAALDAKWSWMFPQNKPKDGAGAPEMAAFLLELSSSLAKPERQKQVLAWLESLRETDPKAKGYHNLRWTWGEAAVQDQNGVEFVNRQAVLAYLLHGRDMPADLAQAYVSFLNANLDGIRRHKVQLSYTNIALMRSWNLLALGQALHDAAAFAEGKQFFDAWYAQWSTTGAREFLSPTYTAVDFENLGLIRRFAEQADVKREAQAALDGLWAVVLTHWFAPGDRLGGTHSRDYGRLTGHDSLDRWVHRLAAPDQAFSDLFDNLAWAPPSVPVPPLAPGSTATLRWDQDSYATWYRGTGFGIGTATDGYWDMDKTPFVADLGGGPDEPQVVYWMDARRDYYGHDLILESSGHMKSLHLRPFRTAAQRGREVLFLASGNSEGQDRVESTFSLPADARYYLDGQELNPFHKRSSWTIEPAEVPGTAVRVEAGPSPVLVIDDADAQHGIGVQRILPATPGAIYRTTVTGRGDVLGLYQNYLDVSGKLIGGENIRSVKGTSKDSVFTQETVAPPGAVQVRVWLYSSIANKGTFRISDVKVEEVSGGTARTVAAFDWQPFQAYSRAVPQGSTLVARLGNAALALRVVAALGPDGRPAPLILSNDGLAYGAFRLTATQSAGPTTQPCVFAAYAAAADVADDAAFAAFLKQVQTVTASAVRSGTAVRITAQGMTGPLQIDADLAAKTRTLTPNPAPAADGTFWIDGMRKDQHG
jgi:hypothetical protein